MCHKVFYGKLVPNCILQFKYCLKLINKEKLPLMVFDGTNKFYEISI